MIEEHPCCGPSHVRCEAADAAIMDDCSNCGSGAPSPDYGIRIEKLADLIST